MMIALLTSSKKTGEGKDSLYNLYSSTNGRGLAQADRRSALLRALDEALGLFGETVRSIVYYYLEARYAVKRTELYLPENLDKLADLIREIFGPTSSFLESLILDKLCSSLGINRASLPKKFKDALARIYKEYVGSK